MTDRAFHDAILKENGIPIDMIRPSLTEQTLTPDYKPDWKFYAETPRNELACCATVGTLARVWPLEG